MAYIRDNFNLGRGKYNNHTSIDVIAIHTYTTDVDSFTDMQSGTYFPDFFGFTVEDVRVNDLIHIKDSTNTYKIWRVFTTTQPVNIIEEGDYLVRESFGVPTVWDGAFSTPQAGGLIEIIKTSSGGGTVSPGAGEVIATFVGLNETTDFVDTINLVTPLQTNLRPAASSGNISIVIPVLSNGASQAGLITIQTDGNIIISANVGGADFAIAANSGFLTFPMVWETNPF